MISNNEIRNLLKENWSIIPSSIKKSQQGNVNHNWIIYSNGKKYVLRKPHGEYTNESLKFELYYLKELQKNFTYQVPAPIKTKNGKLFIKNKNGIFWLYEFINGKLNKCNSTDEIKQIAKMIAKYHNWLTKAKLNNNQKEITSYNVYCLKEDFKNYTILAEQKLGEKERIFLKEFPKLISILDKLDYNSYNSLKQYPIHRDLNPENLLWKKGKLLGVLDFDNVGNTKDVLMRDLAVIIQYSCSDKKRNLNLAKIKILLKEYKKYRKISRKEIMIIPDLLISTYIEDFGYSYWMLLNDPERAKVGRLKKYSSVAQKIFDIKDKLKESLQP